jgi:hypothetical protein
VAVVAGLHCVFDANHPFLDLPAGQELGEISFFVISRVRRWLGAWGLVLLCWLIGCGLVTRWRLGSDLRR